MTEITLLIIKITISSLVVIGLKMSFFSSNSLAKLLPDSLLLDSLLLDSLLSANHIQRCSLNQPITFKVVIRCACARAVAFVFLPLTLEMFTPSLSVF